MDVDADIFLRFCFMSKAIAFNCHSAPPGYLNESELQTSIHIMAHRNWTLTWQRRCSRDLLFPPHYFHCAT